MNIIKKNESGSGQADYSLTFDDAISFVLKKAEIECFSSSAAPLAKELCLIIAEVLCLPGNVTVQIGEDKLPCSIVKSVFSKIEHENLNLVIENYKKIKYKINHKKTYLRTAPYNSIFEAEATYQNYYNMI